MRYRVLNTLFLMFGALAAHGQIFFTGSFDGSWENPKGDSGLVTTISNGTTATFSHGETKLDLGNGEFLEAGTRNILTYTPISFRNSVPVHWFLIGVLEVQNGTTFYNSEASEVTLHFDVPLTNPKNQFQADLNLTLTSTENSSDRISSADMIEIKNPLIYAMAGSSRLIVRFRWSPLDTELGFSQGAQYSTYEGATSKVQLYVSITEDPSYNAYNAWRIQQGLNGETGQMATDDTDQDGLSNDEEFVFCGNPLRSDSGTYGPSYTQGSDHLKLTYHQNDGSRPLKKVYLEFSNDLVSWGRLLVPDKSSRSIFNAILFDISENGDLPNKIIVTIPRDQFPNFFVRLKIGN